MCQVVKILSREASGLQRGFIYWEGWSYHWDPPPNSALQLSGKLVPAWTTSGPCWCWKHEYQMDLLGSYYRRSWLGTTPTMNHESYSVEEVKPIKEPNREAQLLMNVGLSSVQELSVPLCMNKTAPNDPDADNPLSKGKPPKRIRPLRNLRTPHHPQGCGMDQFSLRSWRLAKYSMRL